MKKLPIGIQTFEEIRGRNYIYVDKTEVIHRLITEGKYFFLSRPRRFGKSLTLSTIKAIYEGKKELFNGLWIGDHWDWNKTAPVVHVQFNEIGYKSNGLETALFNMLKKQAELYGVILEEKGCDQQFKELLEKVSAKHGKVVLLIDEYDKPLIDYLEKEKLPIAKKHQEILKNFYSILKSADPHIEFLLLTGVSKFSRVSVFSDLNNLRDITLSPDFATLTGYTQGELETYFKEWLDKVLLDWPDETKESMLKKIKTWYDGYTWNGRDHLYNPFSILNFFADGFFQDYWFKTGTPSFLIKKMEEQKYFSLSDLQVNQTIFENYTLDNLEIRSLLFQTGYLTIKSIDRKRGLYTLGYPNREVEESMNSHLIGALLKKAPSDAGRPVVILEQAFIDNNVQKVVSVINTMLKDIPSHLFDMQPEHFYHALVHLHFRYLGFFIQSEVHTSDGRMDATVHTHTHIYLLEFKLDQSADVAIQQIKNKGYAEKYLLEKQTIVAIGINFDTEKRKVDDWQVEEVNA